MKKKKTVISQMTKLEGGLSSMTVIGDFLASVGRDVEDDRIHDSADLKIWTLPSGDNDKNISKFTLLLMGKPDGNDGIFQFVNRIMDVPLIGTQDFLVSAMEFAHNLAMLRLSIFDRSLCVGYCAPILGIGSGDLRIMYEAIRDQEEWMVEHLSSMGMMNILDES